MAVHERFWKKRWLDGADVHALAALSQTYVAQKQTAAALQKVKDDARRQPKLRGRSGFFWAQC